MIYKTRDKLVSFILYNEFASNFTLSVMTFFALSGIWAIATGSTEINVAAPLFFSGFVFVALSTFDIVKRHG